jgi:hypothetical protein
LLAFAKTENLHWRYEVMASTFLELIVRRDYPVQNEILEHFARKLISVVPSVRRHSLRALVNMTQEVKQQAGLDSIGYRKWIHVEQSQAEQKAREYFDSVNGPAIETFEDWQKA